MRYTETANGPAYTLRSGHASTTIIFPSGATPWLVWNNRPIPIDSPDRFGPSNTPAERAQFLTEFVNATISLNGSQAAN